MGKTAKHTRQVEETLKEAYLKHGYESVDRRTPLDEIIEREEGGKPSSFGRRLEVSSMLMSYFFNDGPHPGRVMKRVYAYAKALHPKLIMDMSLRDMAKIFDETPAAVSERIQLMFNEPMRQAGYAGFKFPWQKDESACAKYSQVQRGNSSRSRGAARRRAESKPQQKGK